MSYTVGRIASLHALREERGTVDPRRRGRGRRGHWPPRAARPATVSAPPHRQLVPEVSFRTSHSSV